MPITTTPSGGAQGEFSTYTPIYSQTLSTTTSTVTFNSIPLDYTDLVLVAAASRGITGSGAANFNIQFNGDTGSNYSATLLFESPGSARTTSQTNITWAGTVGDNNFMPNTVHIMNYSNPNIFKTILGRLGSATDGQVRVSSGLWRSYAPITSITMSPTNNFGSGTTLTLYGIKAATPAPKATGGDVVNTDGTYWYHAFKTTGLFDVKTPITADILVVAGGGASPANGAGAGPTGGGGAGGLLYFSSQSLSVATNTVTVGAGGAYTTGSDSQFAALTLVKGGGAGGTTDNVGGTGGSGGGSGGRYTSAGGANTSGQGSVGGVGYQQSGLASGGGGGKGQAGWGAVSNAGGYGGDGVNTYSSWATATGTGSNGYYAGGGAGMSWYSGVGGNGGAGGGGNGASTSTGTNATNGTASTGGGGGGSSYGTFGGSGVVIVRYPV